MTEQLPAKLQVSDQAPLATSEMRDSAVFQAADPQGEVPDVILRTGTVNPMDRPRRNAQRVGIYSTDERPLGALNLVQAGDRSWVNDIRIEQAERGNKVAVASYLGMIGALHELDRPLESDPGGLSDDSVRVWQSLHRRGVAEPTGEHDQHGHPRFVSNPTTS